MAAAAAGEEGLHHENVAQLVTAQLGLTHPDYADNPGELTTQRMRTEKALREVIAYRLYLDLERGWRVTMPNLEQTGLIKVDYADLPELAALEETWSAAYGPLRNAAPGLREQLCRILLDEMRRVLAIDVECLSEFGFEQMRALSMKHLRSRGRCPTGNRCRWSAPPSHEPAKPVAGAAISTCPAVASSAGSCASRAGSPTGRTRSTWRTPSASSPICSRCWPGTG
jgi:hypothetical protein